MKSEMHYIFRLRAVMGNKSVVARTTMILLPTLKARKFGLKTWLKTLLKCFALDTLCSKAKNLKLS